MAKKENGKMAEHENKHNKPFSLRVTLLNPKQKVTNLDTGDTDSEIEVKSQRFEAPVFQETDKAESTGWTCVIGDKPTFVEGTREQYDDLLYEAAEKLVQPRSKQIEAFLYRATQESYQAGKAAALATGNFLTADLRGKIVNLMRMMQAYQELSASDCNKKWLAGYKEGKPGAIKLLKMAQDSGDEMADF